MFAKKNSGGASRFSLDGGSQTSTQMQEPGVFSGGTVHKAVPRFFSGNKIHTLSELEKRDHEKAEAVERAKLDNDMLTKEISALKLQNSILAIENANINVKLFKFETSQTEIECKKVFESAYPHPEENQLHAIIDILFSQIKARDTLLDRLKDALKQSTEQNEKMTLLVDENVQFIMDLVVPTMHQFILTQKVMAESCTTLEPSEVRRIVMEEAELQRILKLLTRYTSKEATQTFEDLLRDLQQVGGKIRGEMRVSPIYSSAAGPSC